jgi:hypothetical protein
MERTRDTTTEEMSMDTIPVTQYGSDNQTARASSFRPLDAFEVVVKSWDPDNNDRVFQMAIELRDAAELHHADLALVASLREKLRVAESKVPPKVPARLMGTGCVRFDGRGDLWLLNCKVDPATGRALPSAGFGEFGFVFPGGWDELFRAYNVRVTSHSSDAHGPFWLVENVRAE